MQIVHIRQPGTKFQISELCFPSQWYQQNNKYATKPSMTQSIPNNWTYTSTKNELLDSKSASDPKIPHYNRTYNNNSPKGNHEA